MPRVPNIPASDWKSLPEYLKTYFRRANRQQKRMLVIRTPIRNHRPLTRALVRGLRDCGSVLELGCMFGKMLSLAPHARRVGVEVHRPYLERAEQQYPGPAYICEDAREYIEDALTDSFEAVILIDFIEHFDLPDAHRLIRQSKRIASKKVICFAPYGDHPQTEDAFGMGADHWQTHRSTWLDTDLQALDFKVEVWDNFHNSPGKDGRAIYGVWMKQQGQP